MQKNADILSICEWIILNRGKIFVKVNIANFAAFSSSMFISSFVSSFDYWSQFPDHGSRFSNISLMIWLYSYFRFEFNSDLPLLNFRLLTHQMNSFLAIWDRQTFLSNFFCIENSRTCCLCRDLKWTWGWQNCYCRITCFSNQLNNFLHCQLISCEKELTMIYYCIYFLLWKSECHISGVHNYSPKIQSSGKAVVSQNLSGSLDFVTEKLMHTLQ